MALAVFGLCLTIWALGRSLRWSKARVWGLISVVYLVALAAQFAHPEGTPAPWAILGGLAVIVWGYGVGLSRLKARAAPQAAPAPQGTFGATELERYARHIVLRELGGPGQKKLKNAKVLVIGAGGLGSPVLMYLAAAGVGTIGVIDDDLVDHSNLQRQVIHRDDAIGTPKVHSAAEAMRALNPYVHLRPYQRRLTGTLAAELFAEYDVIIDGTDNFATRYLSNAAAVALKKPLVSGALAQWEGQLSVFDPARGGPCYQCIFPQAPAEGLAPSCSEAGVVAPLPGIIGSMMALETVKLITGAGHILRGEMLIYDGLYGESRKIKLAPRDGCLLCQPLKGPTKETP
ncbi:MAG: HesA/MoeB/ThiF family protein [Roseobacter sp.]|nr:HesA/MoeB/ThiF family protein [Roseobacter sp.]